MNVFGCQYHCTSAIDCLERLVSEMTYYVSSGTLNPTHSLTHSLQMCARARSKPVPVRSQFTRSHQARAWCVALTGTSWHSAFSIDRAPLNDHPSRHRPRTDRIYYADATARRTRAGVGRSPSGCEACRQICRCNLKIRAGCWDQAKECHGRVQTADAEFTASVGNIVPSFKTFVP